MVFTHKRTVKSLFKTVLRCFENVLRRNVPTSGSKEPDVGTFLYNRQKVYQPASYPASRRKPPAGPTSLVTPTAADSRAAVPVRVKCLLLPPSVPRKLLSHGQSLPAGCRTRRFPLDLSVRLLNIACEEPWCEKSV